MSGAILIVARNCLHLTKATVRTALNQSIVCDVLVIDNGSKDGTSAWLRSKAGIAYVSHGQVSLAACWNRGIKALLDCGHDRVLVLNNDVEIPPKFYQHLSYLSQRDYPFVTGVAVDNRSQVPNFDIVSDWGISPHPCFSAFMVTREVIDRVGWFDEEYYPAYFEDNDMDVRMRRAGITAVSAALPFYHAGSQVLNNGDDGERGRIHRGFDSNKERFRRKYGCIPGTEDYCKLFA